MSGTIPAAATVTPIGPAEFAERRARLLAHLHASDLSGVALFDPYHVLYYTGFAFIPTERPIAFLMNADGSPAMFVPQLEAAHAASKTGIERVFSYVEYPFDPHPMQVLAEALRALAVSGPIGADSDGYPWVFGYRGPALGEVTGARIAHLAGFVEDRMAIKSEAELALIREACRWGAYAHRRLQDLTRPGLTETEVSMRASHEATTALLESLGGAYRAQSMYGDGPSAGYRGQIGRNAAVPHALTDNLRFADGDVLVTGAGCPMWGYNSELERTMFVGRAADPQRRLFDHMVALQDVAFAAIRPGATCADVDRAVRAYFKEHDLMRYWKHHTGHAIGLRYHEGPFLDVGDATVIEPGMVFTVEPGLYDPEWGGFRHSDTVRVTGDGIEMLTEYPRDLEALTIPA